MGANIVCQFSGKGGNQVLKHIKDIIFERETRMY